MLFNEFDIKVFGGKKTPIEKKALLTADWVKINIELEKGNKLAVETYIKYFYGKLKSSKLLIKKMKEDEAILTKLQTKEQINEIYSQLFKIQK